MIPPESGPTPVTIELDERGRLCPLPVIALAKAVVGLPAGTMIRLLADDPAAEHDVPAWCRMRGQRLVAGHDGTFLIEVARAIGAPS